MPIPRSVCDACGRTWPDWSHLSNPDSETVIEALSRVCDICQAAKGELCRNTIVPGTPLPGRIIHIGRTEPR